MKAFSVVLGALLCFNAAARTFAQASALAATASKHRTAAIQTASPVSGACLVRRHARRRRSGVAKLSFASAPVLRLSVLAETCAVASLSPRQTPSGSCPPPDHPPA